MKTVLCVLIMASAVSMIFGSPKNYLTRQKRENMHQPMENAGFPNGAQVLVKLPMEPGIPQEMGMPSKDKMPNNHMRPVLKEPRGNLFNLSAYLNTNRPTTGTGLTFVPLATLFSGLFQG